VSEDDKATPIFLAMDHDQAEAHFRRRWEKIVDEVKSFPCNEKLRMAADFLDCATKDPKQRSWLLKIARQIAEEAVAQMKEAESA